MRTVRIRYTHCPYLQILLFFIPSLIRAQGMEHTYIFTGSSSDYNYSVSGSYSDRIHIWQTPSLPGGHSSIKTKLHVFLFNKDLQLQQDHPIEFDNTPIDYIYPLRFQKYDHGYLVSITYRFWEKDSEIVRNMVLPIDDQGNIDQSPQSGLPQTSSVNESTPGYSVISQGQTLFAAVIQNDTAIQQLHIRRSSDAGIDHIQYAFPNLALIYPRLASGRDKKWWVLTMAGKYPLDPRSKLSFDRLILARPDTGLSNPYELPRILPFKSIDHLEFVPEYTGNIDTNLILITTGRKRRERPLKADYVETSNSLVDPNINMARFPIVAKFRYIYPDNNMAARWTEMTALRFTILTPGGETMMDSIMLTNLNGAHARLGELLVIQHETSYTILLGQRLPNNVSGIHACTIDNQGHISEKDLNLPLRYQYQVGSSTQIGQNTLLMPFTYKTKTGFLLLKGI